MERTSTSVLGFLVHQTLVLCGAAFFTAVFFFVLPLIQAINKAPEQRESLTPMDVVNEPPPPPEPDEPEKEEEQEEEPPPELEQEPQPLDLSQLESALNDVGVGSGWISADLVAKLGAFKQGGAADDVAIELDQLDKRPRAVSRAQPVVDGRMRQKAPGKVWVAFVVDEHGRVSRATVQETSDPVFNDAALSAVRKWKFEPGERNGKPVPFRMRIPIIFKKT